jgi:hypothetical protein
VTANGLSFDSFAEHLVACFKTCRIRNCEVLHHQQSKGKTLAISTALALATAYNAARRQRCIVARITRRRMIYLDTSFLTPLFREEATSAKVAEFLSRQAAGTLAVSKWASVEFASLTSRDVLRMGALTVGQGRKLITEFDSIIAASLVVLIPSANDFDLAQEYVANFGTQLRGPEALHLAVAHSNGMELIATLDSGMLSAAKKLKISARRVIR